MRTTIERIDGMLVSWLRTWSAPLLRISIGVVFIWFGALKVFDVSPVSELVAATVYWVDPGWFVPVLGIAEVVVGVFLVVGVALRPVLLVFVLQMIGTALVFVVLPEVAFADGNLLKLTVEGEFVVKNLVLLTAGLVIGAGLEPLADRSDESEPAATR
jgi:uncharacterized membrane protein YphA (DoxX/SURF4 family)